MLAIIDEQLQMPLHLLPATVEAIELPAKAITPERVKKADMLFIGSRTRADATLLTHSQVRFVGTATAGEDHLDTCWLDQHSISWASAGGANSMACAQYVLSVLAALQANQQLAKQRLRAGVIGVGRIGSLVAEFFKALDYSVICNDPPRSRQDPHFQSIPLKAWRDLDIICLHVTLNATHGESTYQLIDSAFLSQQQPDCAIINASRGAVISETAMLSNPHCQYCLDVWEQEPAINLTMLDHATLGTPHIAGYSVTAKQNLNRLIYRAAADFWGWPTVTEFALSPLGPCLELSPTQDWQNPILAHYDPRVDDQRLRAALKQTTDRAAAFNELRRNYHLRTELSIRTR